MTGISILLAEDDGDDREFFFSFLRDRNDIHLLPAVENGEEVLTYLNERKGTLPDIIILDQNMPKMNGLQTLIALRKEPAFHQTLLVVYSTYADDSLTRRSLDAGAALVINKPTTALGYHQLIDLVLARKGRTNG